ncbi:MAG TPA: hypothetical protein VHW44_29075 [Pseudonocardiaceae bacterium]|jgi:hypothetical protein|nr:hypothetical protein [Pseudonocardiaceae bacterium]
MTVPPYGQPLPPVPAKRKHRRRWPWITGGVIVLMFVLVGVFGNGRQPATTPTSASITTTTATPMSAGHTTAAAPVSTTIEPTTIVPALVAPPITTTVAAAPHTTTHQPAPKPTTTRAIPKPAPKPIPKPAPKPAPTTTAAASGGAYHAGEFCSALGATAISSTGASMTCIQEGTHKRWHNN